MDLNRATIIGRLVADPETRTTPTGLTVASFRVATNFTWTNQEGQKQEKVEYHRIVAWRKLGEICSQFLKKGRRVYIEGRIETRSWEDPSGNKRYFTDIIADNMIMLDQPFQSGQKQQSEQASSDETTISIEEESESNLFDLEEKEEKPEKNSEKKEEEPF